MVPSGLQNHPIGPGPLEAWCLLTSSQLSLCARRSQMPVEERKMQRMQERLHEHHAISPIPLHSRIEPGQVVTKERFTKRNRVAMNYLWIIYLILNPPQSVLLLGRRHALFELHCPQFRDRPDVGLLALTTLGSALQQRLLWLTDRGGHILRRRPLVLYFSCSTEISGPLQNTVSSATKKSLPSSCRRVAAHQRQAARSFRSPSRAVLVDVDEAQCVAKGARHPTLTPLLLTDLRGCSQRRKMASGSNVRPCCSTHARAARSVRVLRSD